MVKCLSEKAVAKVFHLFGKSHWVMWVRTYGVTDGTANKTLNFNPLWFPTCFLFLWRKSRLLGCERVWKAFSIRITRRRSKHGDCLLSSQGLGRFEGDPGLSEGLGRRGEEVRQGESRCWRWLPRRRWRSSRSQQQEQDHGMASRLERHQRYPGFNPSSSSTCAVKMRTTVSHLSWHP